MENMIIRRLAQSKYFSSNFLLKEEQELQQFGAYEIEATQKESRPNIAITNTDISIESLWNAGSFEQTKLIIHPNSGYDNFSKKFIQESGIPVILGNPIRQEAVVAYCLSSFFQASSAIPWKNQWDNQRFWSRVPLSDLSVMIIGHGHVGRSLEKKLRPLTNHIFIHDPFQNEDTVERKNDMDVIFLCCGLNETTHHLVDSTFLNGLKSTVCIINPARGKIIDEQAMLDFSTENPDAQFFLDVYETEPKDLTPFTQRKNIFTSCHIAGVYDGIEDAIIKFESNVIKDFTQLDKETFLDLYQHELLLNKIQYNTLI